MIIKRYNGENFVELFPKTTTTRLFNNAGTTAIFDTNDKIKPNFLPDSVFDSLYFFNTTASGATRNLAANAFGNTFTTNPRRSVIGYYFVANSALTLQAEASGLATVFSVNGCSTTGGSNILTLGVANTSISVGMTIVGTNIIGGTTVASITNSTTIVMSASATGDGGGITVQFQNHFQTSLSGGEESNTYFKQFTLANGSNIITGGNTSNLAVGMRVSGPGIPSSPVPTITAINANQTQFTLSANAQADGNFSLTFNPPTSAPSSLNLEIGDWFIITNFAGQGTSASPFLVTFAIVNNTYELMKGAGSSTDGVPGLVPGPLVANRLQFLRGDGA
jgi:hypothetical protein